ncbi:MAG: hypothetical protein GX557_10825 [Chloroflexi bacterium]|nr:hypothetical protein [Chloroflexota bacterium]
MSDLDEGTEYRDTSLSDEARHHLEQLRPIDIVVGIPSHRNGRTIGEVVRNVVRGLEQFAHQRVLLMNADGGSSDGTTHHVSDARVTPNIRKFVTLYEGPRGKGSAVRAILEAAAITGARACVVIEARAPGITAEWVPSLLQPILSGEKEIAFAWYQRNAYDRALTANVVYPMMRVLLGGDIREPLAGEFAVSGSLAVDLLSRDVWETDVSRFGINAWLAALTATEGLRACQVDLGYRGESGGEPGALVDLRFVHTVGTLFRLVAMCRRLWQQEVPVVEVPFWNARSSEREITCRDCLPVLLEAFRGAPESCGDAWRQVLSPKVLAEVLALTRQSDQGFDFPLPLWTRVVYEFTLNYSKGEGDPDKVGEALLPLFYGRAAAYMLALQDASGAVVEASNAAIVRAFARAKPAFVQQWNGYASWLETRDYWFS